MDPIADMIIALKNAGSVGRESVVIPHSKLKESILGLLKKEGYIKDVEVKESGSKRSLHVTLFVGKGESKIRGVRRYSKPSKRVYKKAPEIRSVKNGYGLLVMTTPNGVMTGKEAKKDKVGGEALFAIW